MTCALLFSLPAVQSKLARYVTDMLYEDFKVRIGIDEVSINIFGGVKLKKVLIQDHHKDTLISARAIHTSILDFKKLIDGDLIFNKIRLDHAYFNLKTYKTEKLTNLDVFLEAFEPEKPEPPSGKHFLLTAKTANISNATFVVIDENQDVPMDAKFTKINADLEQFKVYGPDVNTNIPYLSFLDYRGLFVQKLSGIFSYTKKAIHLDELKVDTKDSKLAGSLAMKYKIEDFGNFINKVQFDIKLSPSKISSNDIFCFYDGIGKNISFFGNTHIKGPLNNLNLYDLKLNDHQGDAFSGYLNIKNSFGKIKDSFTILGNIQYLTTNYSQLKKVLPSLMDKVLPTQVSTLGDVIIKGKTFATTKTVDSDLNISTQIGKINTNFALKGLDFFDNSSYKSKIELQNFDIGTFLSNKDLKKISLNLQVNGKGYKQKYLNTNVKGEISYVDFQGYGYKNIQIDNKISSQNSTGNIKINDVYLALGLNYQLDFKGKDLKYDVQMDVANANLKQLKFSTDSVAIFKGNIYLNAQGNNLDNLRGQLKVSDVSYKAPKGTYNFTAFEVNSQFDKDNIRYVSINSPEIADGVFSGKFKTSQLKNLFLNGLASLYESKKKLKVDGNQFISFDFNLHPQIVSIFYPDVTIDSYVKFKGILQNKNNEFKFALNSSKVFWKENKFENIQLSIDNKNMNHSFVNMDSIVTKQYKMSQIKVDNLFRNDTLFVNAGFNGGDKGADKFQLKLFHTKDDLDRNVVGFKKSSLFYKNTSWFINEKNDTDNKVTFNDALYEFDISDLIVSHENQEMRLFGNLKGDSYKDLKLRFRNVDLNKITPNNEDFNFEGRLNGVVNFEQTKTVYNPTAALEIKDLKMNSYPLGILKFTIEGDADFRKFKIFSNIENDELESFNCDGMLEFVNKKPFLDMRLQVENFNIGVLSPLGGDILTNIHGFVSGNASIEGPLSNPDVNGRLFVDKAGLKIPYLNIEYALKDKSIVDVTNEKFLLRNNILIDSKFNTQGVLTGFIKHKDFSDWKLDLEIKSKNLLVLNTVDAEDAAYYGDAFINGKASIKGPVDELFIQVAAKSEKGTSIKIPINNAESVSDNNLVHFVTVLEKNNIKKGIESKNRNYNGLEMEFDCEITPDAEIEVILDRKSGHGMKGRGYGGLTFEINTLGKFNMYGNFLPKVGTYNFKYGGLLDKKFVLRKGGSIDWNGDPLRAQLNLEAVYKLNANPDVLLEASSFKTKIPVEVVIGVRGDLASLDPDFNIEFPTIRDVLKSELNYKLSDKQQRQTQAMMLLSTGGFMSPQGIGDASLTTNLFETASSLLGNIIQSKDDKFQVGFDVVAADRRIGKETDGRFVATISSQINDRVLINGKVGVPFGGINESAIVGNLEVLYRVNPDGTLNLKLFNRENDINYIGQGTGYTQGIGISYEVDFDTFTDLVNKIFRKQKIQRIVPRNTDTDDDENIKLKQKPSKPEDKKVEKVNQEGLIPDDDY